MNKGCGNLGKKGHTGVESVFFYELFSENGGDGLHLEDGSSHLGSS